MLSLKGYTIGFIGLGLMGKPMARNLQRAGAKMIVHNRSQAPMNELKGEGMVVASSPAETAGMADTIITMLTDTLSVKQVMVGKNGIINNVRWDTLVIDMSTTAVSVTKEMAACIKKKGGAYIDAPVSGGTIGAETGELSIMVGGAKDMLERAMPILETLGKHITHIGDIGSGQVAKTANQVIVGLTIGAVAEALTLVRHAGVDPAKVRQALGGGFADSKVLEVHGHRMIENNFTPGARSTVQRKDFDQAIKLAAELGVKLPATTLGRELYDKLIKAGHGDLDHASLIKILYPR